MPHESMFNGELLLTAHQLEACFLMVNGRLRLDESMTPELIVEMVAGGMAEMVNSSPEKSSWRRYCSAACR